MEIKFRHYPFGIFHVYSYWSLIVGNTPSFRPNPYLKLKLHARAERQEQSSCVRSWRRQDEEGVDSLSPAGKKKKSRFHRQLTAKNDFNNRAVPLSEPIGLPPENRNKIKN